MLLQLVRDVCGIDLSFQGHSAFDRRVAWPQSADILVIGRNARIAGWLLWREGATLYNGDEVSLRPHSLLHTLRVALARIRPNAGPVLSDPDRAELCSRAAQAFSVPGISRDLDNLMFVSENRTGKKSRLCFLAVDLSVLPAHYSAAIVLLRAIENGEIVLRAVPLVDGFRNIALAPPNTDYKHPEGAWESVAPLSKATVSSSLELLVGENKLSIKPVYA